MGLSLSSTAALGQKLSGVYRKQLTEDGAYGVVDSPGPGLARLRIGIAALDASRGALNKYGFPGTVDPARRLRHSCGSAITRASQANGRAPSIPARE